MRNAALVDGWKFAFGMLLARRWSGSDFHH
jgi:hypothetical protein